ncbi:MAG: YncE family protein [Gemmatimonadota bacterium]|nr:YncE family protein [Gemmatimonadota bacterium]MDE3128943.1 YncE family protein [Gemmatimonadota bacterium]MDE3215943.1 YncE family protein [Gemmatimonadota bacterium]
MPPFRTLPALAALALALVPPRSPNYHVTATHVLGGDGGWDYVTLDTAGHRLFVARENRFMVVEEHGGKVIAEIPGFERAHGVAFAYGTGRAFATSGADSAVRMIDLKTLKVVKKIHAAVDDDGIIYDAGTNHVFAMDGDAGMVSMIDPRSGTLVANIPLTGKPEFGIADGAGHLFVNIEDKAEIDEVSVAARKVTRSWSIAPCKSPTGLAIDAAHHRLFSGCRSGVMAVSDAAAGRLVATVPIGQGVDATRFDAATQLAFASCGDGTITVIHEDAPDKYTVVQTARTEEGARTMELDPVSHELFTVTAKFGPRPEGQRGRPPVLPNSFTLLTLGR